MQAQNIMWGPTWMTVGMFFANLVLNIVGSRTYGFWGVAYAQSAGRIVQFLLLVCEAPALRLDVLLACTGGSVNMQYNFSKAMLSCWAVQCTCG